MKTKKDVLKKAKKILEVSLKKTSDLRDWLTEQRDELDSLVDCADRAVDSLEDAIYALSELT